MMFQLVPTVPTLKSGFAPGQAGWGRIWRDRTDDRRPDGPERPFWEEMFQLQPEMFQDVPTLKSRRQYRTSECRFLTILWPVEKIARLCGKSVQSRDVPSSNICYAAKYTAIFEIFLRLQPVGEVGTWNILGTRAFWRRQAWHWGQCVRAGRATCAASSLGRGRLQRPPHPSHSALRHRNWVV